MNYILLFFAILLLPVQIRLLLKYPTRAIIFTALTYITQFELGRYIGVDLMSSPIVMRFSDPFFLTVVLFIMYKLIAKQKAFNQILLSNLTLLLFLIYFFIHSLFFFSEFGYVTISEIRTKFNFIILILYVFQNIQTKDQIFKLFKETTFIMLLFPAFILVNILFTGTINLINRPINALTYVSFVLGVASLFVYSKYFIKKGYSKFAPFFMLFLVVSIITHHRSGWSVAGGLIIVLLLLREIKKSSFSIVIISLSLIIPLLFNEYLVFALERAQGIVDPMNDGTGRWRFYVWYSIIDEIILHGNYWGMGLGSRFELYVPEFRAVTTLGTHNQYMTNLYYLGIPGLFLFLLFLITSLIKIVFKYFTSSGKENKYIYILGVLGISANLIYMLNYETDIFSWLFFAGSLSYMQLSKKVKNKPITIS